MEQVVIRGIIFSAILLQTVLSGCNGEFPSGAAQHRASARAFDSELLRRSLKEIEAWHIKNRTGLGDSLQKGISVSSIESAFEGTACSVTDELKALWSWRNGEDSPAPFIWYHDFLSMEESLSEYKRLRGNPLVRWDPNYVPVFTFDGEWYAAYCGPKGGAAGPVAHFFLEDEPRITHINVTVFLSTMAEILESGAARWENGAMVEDINQVYRVHQKHNIGYEFPYRVPKGS